METVIIIVLLLFNGFLAYERFIKDRNFVKVENGFLILRTKDKVLYIGVEGEIFVVREKETNPNVSNTYAYYVRNKKNTK